MKNKELLQKNFKEVVDNLRDCESYIQQILDGNQTGNASVGRLLDECMTQFSNDEMALLESTIATNFEDTLMIGSLSKLQQHQLRISERLNSIFADSVKNAQLQQMQQAAAPTQNSSIAPKPLATKPLSKKAEGAK